MNVADNLLTKASPRRKVFIIIKNLLVLQKSPDIDPPPGGDPDLRRLFLAKKPTIPRSYGLDK